MSQSFLNPTSPELFFRGRPGDPRIGDWVKPATKLPLQQSNKHETIAIVGFPDDEGVTRNRGRAGAKGGPDGIRKHLFKLCPPMDVEWEKALDLYDCGNLTIAPQIQQTHDRAQASIATLAEQGATLIALGGGHDFAAPIGLGAVTGFAKFRNKRPFKAAMINIDPHLDVRPFEGGLPHSGTPFRTLLESGNISKLCAFGIRPNRNARDHFRFASEHGVAIRTLEEIRLSKKGTEALFSAELKGLAATSTLVGVTIDLDSCSDAEGSSAAPVLGFTAWELCRFAFLAGREPKVKWMELAEAAPTLDPTERICRIAAEIIFFFMMGRANRLLKKGR